MMLIQFSSKIRKLKVNCYLKFKSQVKTSPLISHNHNHLYLKKVSEFVWKKIVLEMYLEFNC